MLFLALLSLVIAQDSIKVNPDNRVFFLSNNVEYLWPTNASDYLSATFGETRSAHFHAAIDIGTWGREGYDVYAARDGLLFRVGISPHGYGNVIYLQHDDGSFTVYAHLQDFNREIRSVVDSIRFENYEHSFDKILSHNNIRYKRGEIIGRTGSTGIGPPHLHFEIRSPDNQAINPKLAGVRIADSVPPIISSIAIEPISMDATADGKKDILVRRTERRGNRFDFGTIDVTGITGLSVSASDRSDNGRNVYAVYELRLEVNGELFFINRADSFPMEIGRKMFLDRVYPLLQQGRGGFQRLFRHDGNRLTFYDKSPRDGRLNLPNGSHSIRIIAEDFYGNKAIATGTIRVSDFENHNPPEIEWKPVQPPIFAVQNGDIPQWGNLFHWNKHWMSPKSRTFTNLKVRSIDRPGSPKLKYASVQAPQGILLSGETLLIEADEFGARRLYRIVPGTERTIQYPRQGIKATFFKNTVFDTLYVHFEKRNGRLTISPDTEPLRAAYEIRITLDEDMVNNPSIALYFHNERRRRFDYMESRIEGNTLIARTNRFGSFEIRSDTTAPSVSRPSIWQRSADRQWFASVRAFDLESGIDFNKVEFRVNGLRGIPEYDPFGDVIRFHHPEFRPVQGENIIEIMVPDRAGNSSSHRFTINR